MRRCIGAKYCNNKFYLMDHEYLFDSNNKNAYIYSINSPAPMHQVP